MICRFMRVCDKIINVWLFFNDKTSIDFMKIECGQIKQKIWVACRIRHFVTVKYTLKKAKVKLHIILILTGIKCNRDWWCWAFNDSELFLLKGSDVEREWKETFLL